MGKDESAKQTIKCLNCGKEIMARTVVQKYCCIKCGNKYRKNHPPKYPSITFDCAYCGKKVVTDGNRDKRTRFCCEECEKKYWRHPPADYETSRTNFHSVEEYASWERMTNG